MYEGPFSDWSAEMKKDNYHAKKALNHVVEDDGTFYMPFKLFQKIFYDTTAVDYRENWQRGHRMAAWDRT